MLVKESVVSGYLSDYECNPEIKYKIENTHTFTLKNGESYYMTNNYACGENIELLKDELILLTIRGKELVELDYNHKKMVNGNITRKDSLKAGVIFSVAGVGVLLVAVLRIIRRSSMRKESN